ncbi:MAG TPA: hypothetical protein PLB89_04020 [Flavobacteriales bacterium]|nr:hypothetical protein [Flavobacteriales bacterium]
MSVISAVEVNAQLPEVRFPEIDPLNSYPEPPRDLLLPDRDLEAVEVTHGFNDQERQTLRCVVELLPNGVRKVTTSVSVNGNGVKRPRRYRSVIPLGNRMYISPKKRLINVYHYTDGTRDYRLCTKRGRIQQPRKSYDTTSWAAVWDTTWHSDTLHLQRAHRSLNDTTRTSIFEETWVNSRLLTKSWCSLQDGHERTGDEMRFTYSGDSVSVIRRSLGSGKFQGSTINHTKRDDNGRPLHMSSTSVVAAHRDEPERVHGVHYRMTYDNDGQLTRMAEYRNSDVPRRSLTIHYR